MSTPSPSPTPGKPDPVLVFLHGYDEGAPAPIKEGVTRHGPLRPGNPRWLAQEFVILAPQLPGRGDIWRRYADAVLELLLIAQREHGGDPRRSYLTGFSFGGNGVFDLALQQPETWAALWAVDPTRVPPHDLIPPVWLSIGQVARRATHSFVRALELEPAEQNPRGPRVYLDEGEDHVGSATLAYADEQIYQWLLEHRL